ncbi:phosphodiester glycosidase family protein [Thermopirellula anaerolimosa]
MLKRQCVKNDGVCQQRFQSLEKRLDHIESVCCEPAPPAFLALCVDSAFKAISLVNRLSLGTPTRQSIMPIQRECHGAGNSGVVTVRRLGRGVAASVILCTVLAAIVAAMGPLARLHAEDGVYDWGQAKELYPGIVYACIRIDEPRKIVVHSVRVDTETPGVRLHTTPRREDWAEGQAETDRQTTRDFIRTSRAHGIPCVLAVNADAFMPWPAPFNQNTPTDLAGLAVSEGIVVSRATGSPSLIKLRSGGVRIETTGPDTDLSEVELAVSGFALCLDEGRPIPGGADLNPRTGIGLSKEGRYLVIAVIDGRQPAGLGATTQELGEWLRYFGAHRGINMDGGGSSTLAWWDPNREGEDKAALLNSPVGNGNKMERLPALLFRPSERTVGNNLGVAIDPPSADATFVLPPLGWREETPAQPSGTPATRLTSAAEGTFWP